MDSIFQLARERAELVEQLGRLDNKIAEKILSIGTRLQAIESHVSDLQAYAKVRRR